MSVWEKLHDKVPIKVATKKTTEKVAEKVAAKVVEKVAEKITEKVTGDAANKVNGGVEKNVSGHLRGHGRGKSRFDHGLICDIVEEGTTVLDMGCGNGDLLTLLQSEKKVTGQGIDVDDRAIFECVEKGLRVSHMDFDVGLSVFPDKSFDYVVLNRSLQETHHVEFVLKEALRVGSWVVVGFPNFAHIKARAQIFFGGSTPVTPSLPHYWYNTPNLHFFSILDFEHYAAERKIKVLERYFFSGSQKIVFRPNLFAMNALFVIGSC